MEGVWQAAHGKLVYMKIATWNVNSIRARADRIEDWLDKTEVDVLALQETKTKDETFPFELFRIPGVRGGALRAEPVEWGSNRIPRGARQRRTRLPEPARLRKTRRPRRN